MRLHLTARAVMRMLLGLTGKFMLKPASWNWLEERERLECRERKIQIVTGLFKRAIVY